MFALAAFLLLSPAPPKVSAWLIFGDGGHSLGTFVEHASLLSSVSGKWYESAPDGAVQRSKGGSEGERAQALTAAHANNVEIYGLVANPGFDPASVEAFLSDPAKTKAHVDALVSDAIEDGLDGIDVDYESLKAGDRNGFSSFVEQLGKALHRSHKALAIALHPKTSETGNWDGAQAQDWKRIGAAADYVRVMCYDQHWESSEAGPVADIAWVKQVVAFALTEIPKNKLDIGVPAYGYDWVGKKGRSLDWDDFHALPGSDGAVRDPGSQELTLHHGDGFAWFCDNVSEALKLDLAKQLGVHGVAVWRIGSEDPGWWEMVQKSVSR